MYNLEFILNMMCVEFNFSANIQDVDIKIKKKSRKE